MGAVNAAMGNLEAAVAAYTKARDIDPKIAEIHNNLGLALNRLGHHQEAVDCYRQAVKLKPDYAGAHNNMGLAICDLGKPKEAIDCYLKALKINSDFAEVYNNIGIAQNRLHLHDKAVISYDKAIEINPGIAEVHKNKGIALILMGKNAEAMDALTQALHLNSDIPDAELLYHFSEIPANLAGIDLLSILEKYQKDNAKDFEPIEATGLNLIKATFLHNAGRFEEAWKILVSENQSIMDQLGSEFPDDIKNSQDYLQLLRDQAPDASTGNLSDNNLPVTLFLLGPSRSGKSTLEHMIANSPNAKQGYESSVLDNALYFAANDAGIGEVDYLDNLPTEYDDRLKKHYADLVRNFAAPGQVYTTTAPGIIRNINRAALTLPNVRMVFVKRNIDDNTLRIFMKQYRSSNSYAYNLDNIRKYITWYNEMIDLLHSRFPQISMVIRYEDIISQPEKTLQAVSDLCGIDLSSGEVSVPGDDRGCAKPYLQWMTGSP